MKYFIISLTILFAAVLFAAMLGTLKQKEGFLNDYCQTYTDCTSCAKASGCSWCSTAKLCLDSTTLKSTDEKCNQMNVINSSFRCKSESEPSDPQESDIQLDKQFALYKDRIKNKIPPPNVYTADKIKYSNEDVVSNANNVRNDIQNLNIGLPGIISSSVENNIKPMVKGILAENYYIQGFEDMSDFK
jgi:hypothetical protein